MPDLDKKSIINLTLLEYLLHKICFSKSKKKLIYFDKICRFIKEKLSLENILHINLRNQIFIKIILDEGELELFNNIPKYNIGQLEKIELINNADFNPITFLNKTKFENAERINKIIDYYNL